MSWGERRSDGATERRRGGEEGITLLIDGALVSEASVYTAADTARVRVAEPFLHSLRATKNDGLRLGAMLNHVKGQLQHGQFGVFLEFIGIKRNTAAKWMSRARGGPQATANSITQNAGKCPRSRENQPEQVAAATERNTAMGHGVPLAGSVRPSTVPPDDEIDDGSDDPSLGEFDESELAEIEEEDGEDVDDGYDEEDAEEDVEGPEAGRDRDAAPASALVDLKGAVVPRGIAADGDDARVSDTVAMINGLGVEKLGQPAGATNLPSPLATRHSPLATRPVQLTLADEYERHAAQRERVMSLAERVLVSARGGALSGDLLSLVNNVLEDAGDQIEFLVRVQSDRGQGGSPAAPPALAAAFG